MAATRVLRSSHKWPKYNYKQGPKALQKLEWEERDVCASLYICPLILQC